MRFPLLPTHSQAPAAASSRTIAEQERARHAAHHLAERAHPRARRVTVCSSEIAESICTPCLPRVRTASNSVENGAERNAPDKAASRVAREDVLRREEARERGARGNGAPDDDVRRGEVVEHARRLVRVRRRDGDVEEAVGALVRIEERHVGEHRAQPLLQELDVCMRCARLWCAAVECGALLLRVARARQQPGYVILSRGIASSCK